MFEKGVIPDHPDRYEIGKTALRAAIVQDGGLPGLFDRLRSGYQLQELLDRYDGLLEAAASPDDRERRRQRVKASGEGWEDRLDRDFMTLAVDQPDIRPEDRPALLVAMRLCSTAFPDVPLNEIPQELPPTP